MVKKYIRKFVRWALSDDSSPIMEGSYISSNSIKSRHVSNFGEGTNGMNFVVYNAIGGKVIQFTTYDPVRDRGYSNLYIVTDKEELGEELGQIITKESLSR